MPLCIIAAAADARAVLAWSAMRTPSGQTAWRLSRDAVLPRAHEGAVDQLALCPVNRFAAVCVSGSRGEEHARVYVVSSASVVESSGGEKSGAEKSAETVEQRRFAVDVLPAGAAHCVPAAEAAVAAVGVIVERKQQQQLKPTVDGNGQSNELHRAHVLLGSAIQSDPLTVWDFEVTVRAGSRVHASSGAYVATLSAKNKNPGRSQRGQVTKLLQEVAHHDAGMSSISCLPTQPALVMTTTAAGELRLWDMTTGRVAFKRNLAGGVRIEVCQWSPSGCRFLLVVRDDHLHMQKVVVFDTESGDVIMDTRDIVGGEDSGDLSDAERDTLLRPVCASWLDDDSLVVGGDVNRAAVAARVSGPEASLLVMDVVAAKVQHSFVAHKNRIRDAKCICQCQSRNPTHSCRDAICATASSDGFIKLWSLTRSDDGRTHSLLASEATGARLTCIALAELDAVPLAVNKEESAAGTSVHDSASIESVPVSSQRQQEVSAAVVDPADKGAAASPARGVKRPASILKTTANPASPSSSKDTSSAPPSKQKQKKRRRSSSKRE